MTAGRKRLYAVEKEDIMTYADMFSKVKGMFMSADVSDIHEHLAYQFNITGEAEGIFYAEVKDGKLFVLAFTLGRLKVEGNIDKALRLKDLINSKKKAD